MHGFFKQSFSMSAEKMPHFFIEPDYRWWISYHKEICKLQCGRCNDFMKREGIVL